MATLQLLPLLILTGAAVWVGIVLWRQSPSWLDRLLAVALPVYVICVFNLIFTTVHLSFIQSLPYRYLWVGKAQVIIIPFQGYDEQSILNIIMTVPLGIFIALLGRDQLPKLTTVCLIGLTTGLFNEGMQFILDQLISLNRTVDIMDVIDNGLGVILGYLLGLGLLVFFQRYFHLPPHK
ncbi:VanZ family protein [Levilactobacillus bambusae]|nr:VanZ family protein [Levilactobacillus bambusae]